MNRGKASGIRLSKQDAPIVLGMVAREDRNHDIAAWFGVNQGRIAEVKNGKFGSVSAAPSHALPPKGPPGVKGRRLRDSVRRALSALQNDGPKGIADAINILQKGEHEYDANEI